MTTPVKINKLKAAMQGMSGEAPSSFVAAPALPPAKTPAPTPDRAPSRRGKRVVSAYIDPTAAKQLRLLAVELDTSTQALVEEALNDLFRKHNRSAIA